MSRAAELYPDLSADEAFYGPGSYQPIINALGTVLLQVDDKDYQGDSRVLYGDAGRYGVLIFGWGSCSGCDALQACTALGEVDELIAHIESSVKWFDSKSEAADYFANHDWEGDYCWHRHETRTFIERAKEILSA